jgi:hypothetical protein
MRLARCGASRIAMVSYAGVGVLLFAGGIAVSWRYGIELRLHRSTGLDPTSNYTPPHQSETGPQLVMVYIGSASCAGSNQPALPRAVERLKLRLAGYAKHEAMSFTAIGIALDWAPHSGMEHLEKFGRFDEVAAGYNWETRLRFGTCGPTTGSVQ